MDNQVIRPPETTVEQNSLDAPMPVAGNGFLSQYSTNNGVYSTESLEVNDGSTPIAPRPEPQYAFTPKLNFSKRKALIVSVAITAAVGLLMGGTLMVLVRKQAKNENSALTAAQQDITLQGASQSTVPSELKGENESLLVNGDLITRSNVKISNNGFATTIKVQNLTADQTITLPGGTGTLCLDSNNCNYASTNALAALQAQVSAIGPIPTAGVDNLNGQQGAVTIQGSTNQITVSTANGVVTISTPQNLDANANVQFNSLTVTPTGQIVSNKLVQTGAGNDVSIDAGTDEVVFTAHGQTYRLPNTVGASQTICTTLSCPGSGGGVSASTPGTLNRLAIFTAGTDITSSWLLQNGSTLQLDNGRDFNLLGGNISANGTITGTRLISTISSGTAPLTVASDTLITNLNADLLDGQSGSFYQDAGNLTAGTVNSARISGSYTGITGLGTITVGVWNGTALTDANVSDTLTISSVGTVDWLALNNYPGACPAGQAITQLGDGVTCTTFAAGSGSGNYIQNQFATDQTADFRISGNGAIGGSLGIGDNTPASLLTVGAADAFQVNNSGQVIAGTWQGSAIGIGYGGTGLTATPTNGQLLIGNGSGYTLATLTNNDGTVDILNGAGSIEISVPRADQCSTCADHTLSNLADIVAINKSLLPAAAGAVNLGGSSVPYSLLFLSGSSSSPASNNFTIGGTATTSRSINLPDADGTICLRETCIQLSPGAAQSGSINITGTVNAGSLILGGAATVNSLASAGGNALTLGATGAGQATNLQGNSITFTNGSATYSFNSTTGTRTLCDDSGNCAGTGGGVIASGGSAYNLPVFTSANTVVNSIFSQNAGATAGTVAGTLLINGATLSGASALTVSSTGGANALSLSSGSGTLGLTGSTAIIQRVGNSLTLDINSGANSTLTVTNSNGSSLANLNIEGGVNIGAGQTYKINNIDINTGGTLNNVAYLDQANNFTNVGTTSFGGPITAGTYNGQTISAAASLTGTLEIQGANALRLGAASTNTGAILFRNNAGANTVTLKAADSNPLSSITLTLPSALPLSTECLNLNSSGVIGTQSCASGLSGSGTENYIAKFGVGGASVGDSSIFDDGTDVVIQGGSLILGENGISGVQGILSLRDGANPGRTVSVAAPTSGVASDYTLVLPDDSASDGQCLVLSTTGQNRSIITGSCAAGGTGGNFNASGGDSAVGRLQRITAHNAGDYTGGLSQIYDNGTTVGVGVTQGSALLTVGTESDFTVSDGGAVTADGLSLNGSGSNSSITNVLDISGTGSFTTTRSGAALQLTGAPQASATASQIQLGSALVSGSVAGTYIGANASNGYAGDFVNLQVNGTSVLRVDANGNITSGTINGVTIGGTGALSSGGFTLTLTGNTTLNQNLTTASAVQFSGLTLANALTPANGGTGADTSGALAGAALIFNATTGQFEANRITSSDSSILVTSTDGDIDLTVNSCTTCASTDLSNLAATTNINSTLRAQTGVDLGAAANPFRDLYIYGSSASPSSNNFRITGTATSARTLTLPDTSGTFCLTNTCVMLQSSGHTPQNGYIDISNDLAVGGGFTLGGTATINTITPAASTQLLLGATGSGQTSRLQGTSVSFVSGGITYNFSHNGSGTHTLCDDTGNCAGAGGGVTASGGAAFYLPVFSSANTVVNSIISQDAGAGATIATVSGRLAVSAANTSGTTLAVSNSSFTANNSNLANFSFTNANSTASATTVNGIAVSPTGSVNGNPGSNTLNGIKLNNVTPVANNAFYALNVGTGYDDILRYNGTSVINGSGAVQNLNGQAASFYLNAGNINAGTLAVARGGTGTGTFTANGVLYGNGTSAIGVTAAGTTGQCLVATSGGAPTWGSCAGVGSGVTLQSAYDNSSTAPTPAEIVLADNKNLRFTAADTSTDPSIIMKLNCTGCGTGATGNFLVQNNSGATLFSVAGNGAIQIGTANNGISLSGAGGATTGAFTLSGTARNTKSIVLTAEYAGAVLDATSDATCSAAFNGTMTSGYSGDATPRQNYYNWAASTGQTNQCYDVIVQVPIPRDFSAWAPSNPWSMFVYNSAGTNSTSVYVYPIDTNNTLDSAYAGYTGVSSGTTLASTNLTSPTGTYTAGGYMTLKIRMNSASASTNVRIGNITLNYLSSF